MSAVRRLHAASEVGLALVTLAAVVGMHRLFVESSWLGPLVANAVAAHLLAAVARRRGLSLPAAAGAMALGALLVSTWTCYWSTTALGMPTGSTWSAVQTDLGDAWTLYKDVVAPAPVQTGFVVASALAIWCIAFVADWAAFRLWVPFEATLPAGTLFLFTALLGADNGRAAAAGLYGAALIAFLLVHRVARQEVASHWVSDQRADGRRSLLVAGGALGVIAVLGGTLLGPNLPGADAPGVLDPSNLNDQNDARVTISPLVDIRSRLVDQSNLEVFTVRSNARAYWRLTSLERFDGRIWSSSGSYGKADGDLPEAVETSVAKEDIEQSYRISALSAIWLPSAFQARSFSGPDGVEARYDEDSSTLIVDNSVPTSDGLVYDVTSESPRFDSAELAADTATPPASIVERFLGLPADFSGEVATLAQQLTTGQATPYGKAKALQDHLRTFTYDLNVQAGHSDDVLEEFLFRTQRGYCEQFAGAFAAMARSIGLPARVAVGFTPGDVDPADPTLFRVRGEHAHAWPEVYLDGAGWVPFEPTPGRGIPSAEAYTGVPEAQASAGQPNQSEVTAAPTPTTAPGGSTDTPPDPGEGPQQEATGTAPSQQGDGAGDGSSVIERFATEPARRAVPWVLVGLLGYLAVVPAALVLQRRRRRRRATTPGAQIALAWTEASEEAERIGFRSMPSDTYADRARRLADQLPDAAAEALHLARLIEAAHYTPDGPPADAVEVAWTDSATVQAAARGRAGWPIRVRRWLDPRPPMRAWREERSARQRHVTSLPSLPRDEHLVGVGARNDVDDPLDPAG